MTYRKRIITFVLSTIHILAGPVPLTAGSRTTVSLTDKSTRITIRVYSFAGLSPWVLGNAESEVSRVLRDASLAVNWIDCTPRVLSASCRSPQSPAELVVRILERVLPQSSADALGASNTSELEPAAFIFYDRVSALRIYARSVPVLLGRVMAHEITHLLTPRAPHSEAGLMKGQWSPGYLRTAQSTGLGLDKVLAERMRQEAFRRSLQDGATYLQRD